jgi:predicted nucleotidyltransferase
MEIDVNIIDKILKTPYPLTADSIIHAFVGGSGLHGAKVEGYDDTDLYGCYIEPQHCILGLTPMQHFVWSSSDDAVKNTADDVDCTMCSLQRWGELMLKGNPAILHYLFADRGESSSVWEDFILSMRSELITKKSARQYLGFANSQRMRLTGEKGMGRHGQRPDLIEKYGFDTKFGMHYLRLL